VPLTNSIAPLIRTSTDAKTGVIPGAACRPAELSRASVMLGRCTRDGTCRKTYQRVTRPVLSLNLHEDEI